MKARNIAACGLMIAMLSVSHAYSQQATQFEQQTAAMGLQCQQGEPMACVLFSAMLQSMNTNPYAGSALMFSQQLGNYTQRFDPSPPAYTCFRMGNVIRCQ